MYLSSLSIEHGPSLFGYSSDMVWNKTVRRSRSETRDTAVPPHLQQAERSRERLLKVGRRGKLINWCTKSVNVWKYVRKRFSNHGNLKALDFCFRVDRKHFDFRNYDVMIFTWYTWRSFLQTQIQHDRWLLLFFLIFPAQCSRKTFGAFSEWHFLKFLHSSARSLWNKIVSIRWWF